MVYPNKSVLWLTRSPQNILNIKNSFAYFVIINLKILKQLTIVCRSMHKLDTGTVNSEIFVWVLFLLNFPVAKFGENKTFEKLQNHSVVH